MPASKYDHGHTEYHVCEACKGKIGTLQDYSDSHLTFERRRVPKRWPDIYATGIFHERMVDVLMQEGISGFKAYPMKLAYYERWLEVVGERGRSIGPPRYFRIEILGRVDVDVYEIDNGEGSVCPTCGRRTLGKSKSYPYAAKRVIPATDTWDGSDLCKFRNFQAEIPLCSRRVIDLAAKHQWSGRFGGYTPGIFILQPAPMDWFERAEPLIRQRHPDLL